MREHTKTVAENIKVNEATAVPVAPAELNVNFCHGDFRVIEEFLINYTDLGCQIMILDWGAPVSLAGVQWLEQYL